MADFTLFEVHLHDGFSFSPTNTAPAFGRGSEKSDETGESESESGSESYSIDVEDEESETADETTDETSEESGGRSGGKALLGLMFLVVLAIAAKTLMGGDEELEELDELDDLSEDEVEASQ